MLTREVETDRTALKYSVDHQDHNKITHVGVQFFLRYPWGELAVLELCKNGLSEGTIKSARKVVGICLSWS